MRKTLALALTLAAALAATAAHAAQALNIYSARHYDSDDALYDGFEKATGIPVNVIEGGGPELLARLKAEGRNSPADIFITVDAGNLWLAEKQGVFQPAHSPILDARIPPALKSPQHLWFGFSTRARVIVVNPKKLDPNTVRTYADLAGPKLKGQLCMRPSSAVYNLSLLGGMIARLGPARAEQWARGVVANFARAPSGADTTNLMSVAAGECGATLSNHYYVVRLQQSKIQRERDAAKALTVILPDQDGAGTHVNISGAGLLASAKNKAAGLKFLEYLASNEAQILFAKDAYEFPAVTSVPRAKELAQFGTFKPDPTNVSLYGVHQAQAQMLYDKAGWR